MTSYVAIDDVIRLVKGDQEIRDQKPIFAAFYKNKK